MDIRWILNLLLVSLSFTTLVITLVSYIIFRLRSSVINKKTVDPHPLETQYFSRFAPHLKAKNEAKNQVLTHKSHKLRLKRANLGVIFGLISSIVIGVLASENYMRFRVEVRNRIKAAEEYRDLVAKGMLVKHDFDPTTKPIKIQEYFSDRFRAHLNQMASALQRSTLQLVIQSPDVQIKNQSGNPKGSFTHTLKMSASHKPKDDHHRDAAQAWVNFLQDNKIPFKPVSDFKELLPNETVLIPGIQSLREGEREVLDSMVRSGGSIILTGPVGIKNGLGEADGAGWFTQFTDVQISKNTNPEKNRPSVFVSDVEPLWDLPPGILLPWFPISSEFEYSAPRGISACLESDFNGDVDLEHDRERVRVIAKKLGEARVLWSALDPLYANGEDVVFKEKQPYFDSVILSSLLWTNRLTQFKVASWPLGNSHPAVLAVDASTEYGKSKELIKAIKSHHYPVTVFVHSDTYSKSPETLDLLTREDELAVRAEDMPLSETVDDLKAFEKLEQGRLILEEMVRAPVTGVRISEDKMNERILRDAMEAGFKYFPGDRRSFALAPMMIADGQFVMFPRSANDDLSLKEQDALDTPDRVADQMTAELKRSLRFKGGYFFHADSRISSELFFQRALAQFFKNIQSLPATKATYGELAKWWIAREGLMVEVERPDRQIASEILRIQVKNMSRTTAENAVLLVDSGLAKISRAQAMGPNHRIFEVSLNGNLVSVHLPNIVPAEALVFDLNLE